MNKLQIENYRRFIHIFCKVKTSINNKMDLYSQLFSLLHNENQSLNQTEQQALYDRIQNLTQTNKLVQIVKANYFCMLSIKRQYKFQQVGQILKSCLQQYSLDFQNYKQISESYKPHRFVFLMTKFNCILVRLRLQINQQNQQNIQNQLNQILDEHLGQFHILKKTLEKNKQIKALITNYELILCKTFQLLQMYSQKHNDSQKAKTFKDAYLRIIRKSENQNLSQSLHIHEINFKNKSQTQKASKQIQDQAKTQQKQIKSFEKQSHVKMTKISPAKTILVNQNANIQRKKSSIKDKIQKKVKSTSIKPFKADKHQKQNLC